MNKKDKPNNKVPVSRSPAMICSADGHGENAERETDKYEHLEKENERLKAEIKRLKERQEAYSETVDSFFDDSCK